MKLIQATTKQDIEKGIEALTSIFIDEYPYYSTWIEKHRSQFENGEKIIIEAEEENELVGYVMVHFCSEKVAKMNGIYIFEKNKGKGYATAVLKEVIRTLKDKNCDLLYVQTRLDNNAVVHLFDKTNLELVGTNYHEVEEKNNWVACNNLQENPELDIQSIAANIYDGFKPLTNEEIKQLRYEHKDGNLILSEKRKEDQNE